jgi:cytochrome c2
MLNLLRPHILMRIICISLLFLWFISCSGSNQQRELSDFESEHGIGPITEIIDLGPYDQDLALRGKEIYSALCMMCHGQNDSDIAPSLEGILDRRSPEYVMNMILNPTGMIRWHPTRLSGERYLTSMPYQSLSPDEARAIVEFLRDISS